MNLESESLSKSNDNDNNKLESSFISLLSEKIKSGDLEHVLKLLSKKKIKRDHEDDLNLMSYLSNKNERHDNFNSIDRSSLNKQGLFRLDLSSIRSYEDE
ncbi:uncharacterized protein OCT59_014943 [Rhizophagus irregularis]|uniref:Uncharacterized protein n=1 Tax=Rhizophagus irregularis TaxID=588596 RepID=A0A915ZKP5_9GLOM|nr:hypothetical protein OCT59_014943 [Rhizophagus irregularis]CAB4491658.1 unnamed protein product [Rhizophagus irregularis]CAB5381064.1 unnamed protein product [Rhizophagus irregularis]